LNRQIAVNGSSLRTGETRLGAGIPRHDLLRPGEEADRRVDVVHRQCGIAGVDERAAVARVGGKACECGVEPAVLRPRHRLHHRLGDRGNARCQP
jgi:hypothetical protein